MSADDLLRFDGLYVDASMPGGVLDFVRFYPDGTAVSSGVQPPAPDDAAGHPRLAAQVARWLRREHPQVAVGTYQRDGAAFHFTVVVKGYLGGSIEHTGVIRLGELIVATHSHVTNWRAERRYRFELVAREHLEASYTPPPEAPIDVERW